MVRKKGGELPSDPITLLHERILSLSLQSFTVYRVTKPFMESVILSPVLPNTGNTFFDN